MNKYFASIGSNLAKGISGGNLDLISLVKQSQSTDRFKKITPRGVLPNKEVGGGLGPYIKFGGKIWDKVKPSSQNK